MQVDFSANVEQERAGLNFKALCAQSPRTSPKNCDYDFLEIVSNDTVDSLTSAENATSVFSSSISNEKNTSEDDILNDATSQKSESDTLVKGNKLNIFCFIKNTISIIKSMNKMYEIKLIK